MSEFSEKLARIRSNHAAPPLTIDEIAEHFARQLAEHADHPWEQVGRCVFCVPCGTRLYQGTIPEGHPVGRRQSKPARNLLAEFRERWGQA